MKHLYFLFCAFLVTLGGCTTDIENQVAKEWSALKNYNAYHLVEFTGAHELLKGPQEKSADALAMTCLHEGQLREASFSGRQTRLSYTQCPYTPWPVEMGMTRVNSYDRQ